jgi:hypothetical protein
VQSELSRGRQAAAALPKVFGLGNGVEAVHHGKPPGGENRLDHLGIRVPEPLMSIPDRACGHASRLNRFSKTSVDVTGKSGDDGRTFE